MTGTMNDGYIKFKAQWEKSPPLPIRFIKTLNEWRDRLYSLGFIGATTEGIGYGNLSERFGDSDHFIISGSGTGNLEKLTPDHYSLVTRIDIDHNKLSCRGPIIASSESMSHGVMYNEKKDINAVIHIHHLDLWQELLHQVPTTDDKATYGTPEMAYEIIRLFRESGAPKKKIIVMAGHREGIFTFGKSLDEAGEILLAYFQV